MGSTGSHRWRGGRHPAGNAKKTIESLIVAILFAVFATVGVWFLGAYREVLRSASPCTFVQSKLVQTVPSSRGEVSYGLRLRYTYTFEGRKYESDRIRKGGRKPRDRKEIEELTRRYPEGSGGTCYVSRFDARDVQLEKPSRLAWVVVVFPFLPLVFQIGRLTAVGLPRSGSMTALKSLFRDTAVSGVNVVLSFLIFLLLPVLVLVSFFTGSGKSRIWVGGERPSIKWRGPKTKWKREPAGPLTREASGATGGPGFGCAILGLVPILAFASIVFLWPLYRASQSRTWVAVPCRVLSSKVGEGGNHAYSIRIRYSYEYEGAAYESDRYDFLGGSSSGRKDKERVVARYPAGDWTMCYVNPENPEEAVLVRRPHWNTVHVALLAGFLGIWVGVIWYARRKHRRLERDLEARTRTIEARPGELLGREAAGDARRFAVPADDGWLPDSIRDLAGERGPIELKPLASPWGKFLGMLVMALLLSGFAAIALSHMIRDWDGGGEQWLLVLLAGPALVLVGTIQLYGVFNFFLAIFNPRPVIRVSSRCVRPGETIEIEWMITGIRYRLKSLSITLEGLEEARYRQGTNIRTAYNTFTTIDIFSGGEDGRSLERGETEVAIPEDAIHSFQTRNNRILWTLKVREEIRGWPDVEMDYDIIVLPRTSRMEGTHS